MDKRCTKNRCDDHNQVNKEGIVTILSTNPGVDAIEYWKCANDKSLKNLDDIKICSGGDKAPSCSIHGQEYGENSGKYEGWINGQSSCKGHRSSGGTALTSDNSETIVTGGNNSFVGKLYTEINNELNARKDHSIYCELSTITIPEKNTLIDILDLNSALDVIRDYYDQDNTDISSTYQYTKVKTGQLISGDQFKDLKDEFNKSVITDCICYSDCNEYAVCYCFGNCNYY